MVASYQKRQRAKPVFETELPLRVDREAFTNKFHNLILGQGFRGAQSTGKIERQLEAIACQLQHSRKLERQEISRPNARKSLIAIADMAQELSDAFDAMGTGIRERIDAHFDWTLFAAGEHPPLLLDYAALLIAECATCANVVENSLPASLTAGDREQLVRLYRDGNQVAANYSSAPMGTAWPICLMEQFVERPEFAELADSSCDRLKSLLTYVRGLALAAAETEKGDRGIRLDTARSWAVEQLARVYEQSGGKIPTHTRGEGKCYTGGLNSRFDRFVHAFMQIADTNCHPYRGLAETIANVCWPSRPALREMTMGTRREIWNARASAATQKFASVTYFVRPSSDS